MRTFLILLLLSVVRGDWHQDVFYDEINRFRQSPIVYQHDHPEIVVRCSSFLDETYSPLRVEEALQNSSYFQALTISSNACPVVSHETCPPYCHQFGDCSSTNRVSWFLQGRNYHNILEILIQGPKNPYKIFHHFLESQPHCDHILNTHINAMGSSFVHTDKNIFVADFVYIV